MENKNKAAYPLSGDPFHNGHLDNIRQALELKLFDHLEVLVGAHPVKKYLFNTDERVYLTRKALEAAGLDMTNISVKSFSGLLRNYAKIHGIDLSFRGSRNPSDFEYEQTLADFNREYGLKTIILPASEGTRNISSTLVKAIALEGGMTHRYVAPIVKQALEERMMKVSLVGVTGCIGAGKTTFCRNFLHYCKNQNAQVDYINFDELVKTLYTGNDELSKRVLLELEGYFGKSVFDSDKLDTKKLAGIVFGNDDSRNKLAKILSVPSLIRFEEELKKKKGIVLVDAAYFTEYHMMPLINYNLILVGCAEEERVRRIFQRDRMTLEELEARVTSQHTHEQKRQLIQEAQAQVKHGFFYEIDSGKPIDYQDILNKLNENFPLLK